MRSHLLCVSRAFLTIALLGSVLNLTTGCDRDDGSKDSAPTDGNSGEPIFELTSLAGSTYKTACVVGDNNRSEVETLIFKSNAFTRIWQNFTGTTCDKTKVRTTYNYDMIDVQKEVSSDLDGWDSYVFKYKTLTATPEMVLVTAYFNQINAYGYSDWQLNVAKDIAGRRYDSSAEPKATVGAVRVMTVKIEGKTLSTAAYKGGVASAEGAEIYTKVE